MAVKNLRDRLALAPIATEGIFGDVIDFVKDALIGEGRERFFPPGEPVGTRPPPTPTTPVMPADPIINAPGGTIADRIGFFPDEGGGGCLPFFTRDPITGQCVPDFDPGPGTGLPGGNGAAGTGLTRPRATARTVLECPRFADGKKGILWMNALTGDVVCLPRATNGRGFGLIRKNRPRAKPFISAADKKLLTKITSVQKRAKSFATSAGFICRDKPGQPAPTRKKK